MSGATAPFEELYARNPDPWSLATSAYERDKYAATLDALGPRFRRGLEVGCSIGVLTRLLAGRCDALVAVDVARAALDQAAARCAGMAWVEFQLLAVPRQWPTGRFDLIVLSEVLYFLPASEIAGCAERTLASVAPGGTVLLVNWLGENDRPVNGETAAELFIAACGSGVRRELHGGTASYRLDRLMRL